LLRKAFVSNRPYSDTGFVRVPGLRFACPGYACFLMWLGLVGVVRARWTARIHRKTNSG
jgi:hypothetical protein